MSAKGNIIRGVAMLAGIVLALLLVSAVQPAGASGTHVLTVDGTEYSPDKETGGAVHYFTPGGTPSTAFSERHQWLGNGSELLPCSGRLHWIDNANLLVISHCEETSTTTTTTPSTTTTVPPTTTTTTTEPPATTTTVPGTTTTTTSPETTTTIVQHPTTTDPGATTTTETPVGGVQTGGGALAALVCGCPIEGNDHLWFLAGGAALLALSGLTLYRVRQGR